MKISMKLVYQYMAIFLNFSLTSNHLHPLQVENCDSNSRLVVDEDYNVKSGLKGLRGECDISTHVTAHRPHSSATLYFADKTKYDLFKCCMRPTC